MDDLMQPFTYNGSEMKKFEVVNQIDNKKYNKMYNLIDDEVNDLQKHNQFVHNVLRLNISDRDKLNKLVVLLAKLNDENFKALCIAKQTECSYLMSGNCPFKTEILEKN